MQTTLVCVHERITFRTKFYDLIRSVCVCVYVCVSVYVRVSIPLSVFVFLCVSVCIRLCKYGCITYLLHEAKKKSSGFAN